MTIELSAGSRNVQHGPGGISSLFSSFHPLERSSDAVLSNLTHNRLISCTSFGCARQAKQRDLFRII
jgi:hypothetical protein